MEWICEQKCVGAQGPEWIRCSLVGQLGIFFARVFHRIEDCRRRVNLGPMMASQMFANWNVLTDLRIATHKWALASKDVATKEYFGCGSRDVTRARVRSSLEKSRTQAGADDLPRNADGDVSAETSDDDWIPQVPEDTLLTQTSCPITAPTRGAHGNPTTPKCYPQPAPSTEPDTKVAGTEGAGRATEYLEFSRRRAMGIPASQLITVSQEQLRRAGEEPTRAWQVYSVLYPNGNPAGIAHDPAFASKNFRNLDGSHGWVLGEAMGPVTTSLKVARVGRVGPAEFRTLDENAGLIHPSAGQGVQARKL